MPAAKPPTARTPNPPYPLQPLATCTVAMISLGYVGLPFAVTFATPEACEPTGTPLNRRVMGFDINRQQLEELGAGHDRTQGTSVEELQAGRG